MFADEHRNLTDLNDRLLAELRDDPEQLLSHYEQLRLRDEANGRRLEKADKYAADVDRLRRENSELTRRLGAANAALEAYRTETGRLKGDLKRVRGSRAYRLGRTLGRPAQVLGRATAVFRDGQESSPAPGDSTGVQGTRAGDAARTGPAADRLLSEYTYEELVDLFEQERTPDRLAHVLSRAWFQRGLVHEPAELVRAHPDLVGRMRSRDRVLADRILGEDRLARNGIALPERSLGAAYQVERGRVMYCAHSTPAFNTNGYSVRTRGVASGLRQSGVDVVVVGRSGYPWDTASDVPRPEARRHVVTVDNVDYVHLPGPSIAVEPTDHYILECADAFVREARLLRPSVIHAASNFRVGLAALIAARRLGLPFVYEVRGLWEVTEASDKPGWETSERYEVHSSLESLVAREADHVLAITRQTADELAERGVSPERITLAQNAVDPHQFLPLPKDHAYASQNGLRTDVPVVGFAGSMVPYEGLGLLVEAAAMLRDDGVEILVVLAGSGSAEPELRRQVDELGLSETVRFLGRVPSSEMPRLMSLIDIAPCPRLSSPVTEMVSPLKPLEAWSAAKAVVLSDVAPHVDMAGTGPARALLFRAGDARSLATALRRLVDDADLRTELGRAGRLWCIDERSWTDLATGVLAAHEAAVTEHRSRAPGSTARDLQSLRVGLIADEFTTATLAPSVEVVPLSRQGWRDQLRAGLDLVLIESAWQGNGGQWHRGVGHYSTEEHHELVELLGDARALGVPTVFWNKEDPVHFDRFVPTAVLCDHVFTTDSSCVPRYLRAGADRLLTASALPFFAQPLIHNPLPGSRPPDDTVAYAGTFYGERYPQRSAELAALLSAALPFGLAVYDRQAAIENSPYAFPAQFEGVLRGALPYDEVLDAYKAHVANLNVNSVTESASMFSRRVVEVAASGAVVLSGPGRGIDETFGSLIPTSADPLVWRTLLRTWTEDPQARLREAWLQMRGVLRSHTADTALTIVARTAGIPVRSSRRPTYAVVLDGRRTDLLDAVALQSVPPARVWTTGGALEAGEALATRGILVGEWSGSAATATDYVAHLREAVGRTHFEDLLHATRFGDWDRIVAVSDTATSHGRPIARAVDAVASPEGLVAGTVVERAGSLDDALQARPLRGVELLVPAGNVTRKGALPPSEVGHQKVDVGPVRALAGRTVVVAGHDLKFARSAIAALESVGAEVLIDEWMSHSEHDEPHSRDLLSRADVVLCEWGLGNAVWYSQNVRPDQRLVVRVHSQELRRPHLSRIRHSAVHAYVFVGELVREAAVRGHGVPHERTVVVPNPVDVTALDQDKRPGSERTLGLVGIVPRTKRLDLALDVLEGLLDRDGDYRLRIKGRTPAEYPWMKDRPEEMAYYDEQFERIERIKARHPGAVRLDGHGDDMEEWYRGVGVALSVSDFESFHLTIADGAASGAFPALLAWPGSDLVYPRGWVSASVSDLVARVVEAPRDPAAYRQVARERFDVTAVSARLLDLLAGRTGGDR